MSNFTVCVQYRDRVDQVEHVSVSTERMVQLVRGFNDTFVESFEVFDSEGVILNDSEVWAYVDAEVWAMFDAPY